MVFFCRAIQIPAVFLTFALGHPRLFSVNPSGDSIVGAGCFVSTPSCATLARGYSHFTPSAIFIHYCSIHVLS